MPNTVLLFARVRGRTGVVRELRSLTTSGPNEVSIIHPDVVETLYGASSKCTKSAGYEGNADLTSMHSTRSRRHHDMRRKAWARGFTQSGTTDRTGEMLY